MNQTEREGTLDRVSANLGESQRDLLKEMAEQGSDTLLLRIKRDPTPGKTFSEGPLDEFLQAMRTFVVARIAGRWLERDETSPGVPGIGVHDLVADLKLTLDGQSRTIGADEQPWFVVDGASRADGQRALERQMVAFVSDKADREQNALARVIGSLHNLPDDHLERVRLAVVAEVTARQTGQRGEA